MSNFLWPDELSLPGFSVHGIFQARILEWVAMASSKRSSCPRDQTCASCIGRQILYHYTTWEVGLGINVIFVSLKKSLEYSSFLILWNSLCRLDYLVLMICYNSPGSPFELYLRGLQIAFSSHLYLFYRYYPFRIFLQLWRNYAFLENYSFHPSFKIYWLRVVDKIILLSCNFALISGFDLYIYLHFLVFLLINLTRD